MNGLKKRKKVVRMRDKRKVCKNCKIFVEGNVCPICGKSDFSRMWKGLVIVNDPAASEIAKLLGIKVKGKYAIWVK